MSYFLFRKTSAPTLKCFKGVPERAGHRPFRPKYLAWRVDEKEQKILFGLRSRAGTTENSHKPLLDDAYTNPSEKGSRLAADCEF